VRLASLVWIAATAAVAQPVFEETRVPVAGDWRQFLETASVEFPSPRADFRNHVRLALSGVAADARVALNGRQLKAIPGFRGQYDVSDYLDPRGNKLTIANPAPPSEAALLITPRVFLASPRVEVARGEMRAVASVRNTLENTVNVTLFFVLKGAHGQKFGEWVVDATVPPGTTQDIYTRGAVKDAVPRGAEVSITMDKAEEAMEPAYRYRALVQVDVAENR
jgi:hypothetical protein